MKYLEQRVEELEKEVTFLKAKFNLQETKTTGFINEHPIRVQNKDTSRYLNNYPPSPDWRNKEISDYMFNPSVNLMSDPNSETAFASPWDSTGEESLTTLLSSFADDILPNPDYVDSFDIPAYYPEYPNTIGSWDDKSFNDVINENVTDEYGFKMNDDVITSWGFVSEFDKLDKGFLEWLSNKEPQELKSLICANLKIKQDTNNA
jgi:hypothetical protein